MLPGLPYQRTMPSRIDQDGKGVDTQSGGAVAEAAVGFPVLIRHHDGVEVDAVEDAAGQGWRSSSVMEMK
jgi:hypothetical protein